MRKIIKNAKIYTMSEAGILENADILIKDNQIADGHPTLKGRVCKGRPLVISGS